MKKHLPDFSNNDDLITYLKKNNPDKNPMNIDRLRSYPGCENYTDQQAEDILKLLNELATIILEVTPPKNNYCIDNQYFVNSYSQSGSKTIPLFNNEKNKAA